MRKEMGKTLKAKLRQKSPPQKRRCDCSDTCLKVLSESSIRRHKRQVREAAEKGAQAMAVDDPYLPPAVVEDDAGGAFGQWGDWNEDNYYDDHHDDYHDHSPSPRAMELDGDYSRGFSSSSNSGDAGASRNTSSHGGDSSDPEDQSDDWSDDSSEPSDPGDASTSHFLLFREESKSTIEPREPKRSSSFAWALWNKIRVPSARPPSIMGLQPAATAGGA